MIKGGIGVNERQVDVIMGIVQEQLADYLSEDLTEEICIGIREGINDNMILIEQLGSVERPGKMDDGCLVETDTILELFRKEMPGWKRT